MFRLILFGLSVLVGIGISSWVQGETVITCSDPRGCPDLIVDARAMNDVEVSTRTFQTTECTVLEGEIEAGTRTILSFSTSTPNVGQGDLFIGRPSQHPEWFTFAECHSHFHLNEYSDYRFWTASQYEQWKALKAANPDTLSSLLLLANPHLSPRAGHKQGFCVIDVDRYGGGGDRQFKYQTCDDIDKAHCMEPPAPGVDPVAHENYCSQGLQRGWTDRYGKGLDGQWVDVTGLPPGNYILEVEVNAERMFAESNYANNSGIKKVTLR